jgi:hypothetical protein
MADFTFESSAADLTLAGVGLTNAENQLELMLGAHDGSSSQAGYAAARMRQDGTDASWSGAVAGSGGGTFRATRTAGMLSITFDGGDVFEAPFTADVQNLVVYTVAHRSGVATYPFGTYALDRVQLCY